MTPDDLTYPQPPIITRAHLDAMTIVIGHWPFPDIFDRTLLNDIHAHLHALITNPVPVHTTHTTMYPSQRSNVQTLERSNVTDDCYDCDQ